MYAIQTQFLRVVLVTFYNFVTPFFIRCGVSRRLRGALLTESHFFGSRVFFAFSKLKFEVGSMKEDLQCLALHIFSMCLPNNIRLEVEWIPRSANDRADFLCRVIDYGD